MNFWVKIEVFEREHEYWKKERHDFCSKGGYLRTEKERDSKREREGGKKVVQ